MSQAVTSNQAPVDAIIGHGNFALPESERLGIFVVPKETFSLEMKIIGCLDDLIGGVDSKGNLTIYNSMGELQPCYTRTRMTGFGIPRALIEEAWKQLGAKKIEFDFIENGGTIDLNRLKQSMLGKIFSTLNIPEDCYEGSARSLALRYSRQGNSNIYNGNYFRGKAIDKDYFIKYRENFCVYEQNFIVESVLTDSSNSYLAISGQFSADELDLAGKRQHIIFKVRDSEGKLLKPSEWVREKTFNCRYLPASEVAARPFLSPLLEKNWGVDIPETTLRLFTTGEKISIGEVKTGTPRYTDDCIAHAFDPLDPKLVIYINPFTKGLVEIDGEALQGSKQARLDRKLPLEGKPAHFIIDASGKYLLVVEELNNNGNINHQLIVLERESLQIVAAVPGVKPPLFQNYDTSRIYFQDGNIVRRINTNIPYLLKGGLDKLKVAERNEVDVLVSATKALELASEYAEQKSLDSTYDPVHELSNALEEKFASRIASSQATTDLHRIERQLETLQKRREYQGYSRAFEVVLKLTAEKKQLLQTTALVEQIEAIQERIATAEKPAELRALTQEYITVARARSELAIADPVIRETVDRGLSEIEKTISRRVETLYGSLPDLLDAKAKGVEAELLKARNARELELIHADPLVVEYKELLTLFRDQEDFSRWNQKLNDAFQTRREQLTVENTKQRNAERRLIEDQLEILGNLRTELIETLKFNKNLNEFLDWRRQSSLITKYIEAIGRLPEELREGHERELNSLLNDKENVLQTEARLSCTNSKTGEVRFGKISFPVFPEYSISCRPKVIPLIKGGRTGRLVFEAGPGWAFDTGERDISVHLSDEATRKAIEKYSAEAHAYFRDPPHKIPKIHPSWVINPYVEGKLEELATNFSITSKVGHGYVLIEGAPGGGKNVLVDIFGNQTHRPVFCFSCNAGTEKEDLTHAFMFDPKEGTYRVSAEFVTAIQTPGAIVFLDELNTLPFEAAQLLHPVFDYRRTLNMSHDRPIPVERSVLFVAAQNPSKELYDALRSRSIKMLAGYPPETENGVKTGYEAQIYAQHIDCLKDLKPEEFFSIWNHIVNKRPNNGSSLLITPEREHALKNLDYVVRAANILRDAHAQSLCGQATYPMPFCFSLRDGTWVAQHLSLGSDGPTAMRRIVLPHITNPLHREKVNTLLGSI